MKALILILLLPMLSSCIVYKHTAASNGGNTETDSLYSFGGTSSQRGADGSSLTHDHQASARDFFNFAGTAITAGSAAYVQHGKNAADALTVQQAQSQAAKTAQAKIAADAAAAKAAATPIITTPPQVVTFPPK